MFERPLFQNNILETMFIYFRNYFTMSLWFPWMLIVFFVLAIATLCLRKTLRTATGYQNPAYAVNYTFDNKNSADILAFVMLSATIIATAVRMFAGENSLFENFDLMAINTTRAFFMGQLPSFDELRISPLSFWYLNFLYALSQNILVIKSFVLIQLIISVVLLYKLFNFIPVARRLVLLAVFIMTPVMMDTANIIFPERDVLIVLAASLIFARKYCQELKIRYLAGFLFFMNVAFYTKEFCLIFYLGFIIASFIYNLWYEKFTINNFVHPIKTIKLMPIEFLIFISLFLYSVVYFLIIDSNSYLAVNQTEISDALKLYWLEGIFVSVVGVYFIYYRLKYSDKANPIFTDTGFLVGGLCITVVLIFFLKLIPTSPHLFGKTYYLQLPILFSLAYLFAHIKNKITLTVISGVILSYSIVKDINNYTNETGRYYRETAQFLADNMDKNEAHTIFIIEKDSSRFNLNQYIIMAYSSAYRYYFKGYNIKLKSALIFDFANRFDFSKFDFSMKITFLPVEFANSPSSGDWIILNKQADDAQKNIKLPQPLYSNKVFEVYRLP